MNDNFWKGALFQLEIFEEDTAAQAPEEVVEVVEESVLYVTRIHKRKKQ